MTWKEILKAPPLTQEEEKLVQEEMRFRNLDRATAERRIRRKMGKLGQRKQPTYEDYMRNYKSEIKEEILDEVKEEGGALGMKNLKDIADKKKLKETLSSMEDRKIIFEHEDGDFYTHKPKREKEKGD